MIEVEEVKIEVTTFGSDKREYVRFFVCEECKSFDDADKCGFYDFCEGCKKKFVCATTRCRVWKS